MKVLTRTKTEAVTYAYRFDEFCGWANFTVNNRTGEVSLQSDWGDFSYRWNVNHTGHDSMASFLASADSHYIAGKFRVPEDEPDIKETIRAMRAIVVERRTECPKRYSKTEARNDWLAAGRYAGESGDGFWLWLDEQRAESDLTETLGGEPWGLIRKKRTAHYLRILEVIDVFIEDLKTDAFEKTRKAVA